MVENDGGDGVDDGYDDDDRGCSPLGEVLLEAFDNASRTPGVMMMMMMMMMVMMMVMMGRRRRRRRLMMMLLLLLLR
jgi:hypothetical protein